MREKVVVTGMGLLSPLGLNVKSSWERLIKGESAVRTISRFNTSGYRCKIGAELPENIFFEEYCKVEKLDRLDQYALLATQEALSDAGLSYKDDFSETAVLVGTGLGGIFFAESQLESLYTKGSKAVHPFTVPFVNPNGVAAFIARKWQCLGPNLSICTACASSAHAMGQALDLIRNGRAERVIVGGVETPFMPLTFAGFEVLRVLSKHNDSPAEALRPFDHSRDGFVLGEGAAFMILEKESLAQKRQVRVYAELAGYGASNGAFHQVAPVLSGEDAAIAIHKALEDAQIKPEDIQYVNAHGTGTFANDHAETQAIKFAFQDHAKKLQISSSKAQTGHLIGAAAAIEAIFTILSLYKSVLPATINYKFPDPACDLDYIPNKPKESDVDAAISNSFAFGNNNAVLAFKKYISKEKI